MRAIYIAVIAVFAGVACVALFKSSADSPKVAKRPSLYHSAAARAAEENRKDIDRGFKSAPKEAKRRYETFIADNKQSKDPEVQEEVGAARIRLGYIESKLEGYEVARETFLEAEKEYRGTGTMGADFGGIKDQAAYQAACCLAGDKKNDEAETAFIAFIGTYPESPLVHAARGRLVRLFPDRTDKYDKLLESALEKQRRYVALERASCGPKAIEYLLGLAGKKASYQEIAKLCKTNEDGTSMQAMLKALKAYGLKTEGLLLNRKDFAKMPVPSIWLSDDHYVVVCEVNGSEVIVYDPLSKGRKRVTLPPADSTDFSAYVLRVDSLQVKS